MGRAAAAGTLGHTMAEVILRLRIEGKAFRTDRGELPVLGSIDLALGAREIVALVGPSGCGKTTLLRIIGGLDTDFQGTLDWRGAAMPRIGTVFQEPRLLPWRTVRQNLLLAQRTENPDLVDDLLRHAGPCAVQRRVSGNAVARHGAAGRHRARLRDRAGTRSAGRAVRLARSGDGGAQPRTAAGRLARRVRPRRCWSPTIAPRRRRWPTAYCCWPNGRRRWCRNHRAASGALSQRANLARSASVIAVSLPNGMKFLLARPYP